MNWFVVRGPGWDFPIELKRRSGDDALDYVEAATKVIEYIYSTGKNKTLGNSGVMQVSLSGYDMDARTLSGEDLELMEEHVRNGFIKFIFTPIVLANAGYYNDAEALKYLISL